MKKFLAVLAVVAIVAFAAPAFAANPFMDVPAGHWAYDAVAQLAAKGIVSGYPDGAFKGAQPATRYEVASVVARALAKVDAEKASKQDLEMLKKLVMEFKDELDALGVKVDKLDKRVAVLEDRLGGWKLRGTFQFDARFGDDSGTAYTSNGRKIEFEKERFRLYLTKQIDENTSFTAQYRTGGFSGGARGVIATSDGSMFRNDNQGRGDLNYGRWTHLFVDTKLPYDIDLRVGRFAVDFEGDYGLYTDNDAIFGDYRTDGFQLRKSWNWLTATAMISRNNDWDQGNDVRVAATPRLNGESMTYVLDLHAQPNEKFFIGATGYWINDDAVYDGVNGDWGFNTYGIYAGFKFTPSVELKGIYYMQDFGDDVSNGDDAKAWKIALDVKQDLLKFTSLWIEYSQQDAAFIGYNDRYAIGGSAYDYAGSTADGASDKKFLFIKAAQKWNDKWDSYIRYTHVALDGAFDDEAEYGLGVGYQYTPAIKFELGYDKVDHGDNAENDSLVLFRTTVNF